MLNHINLMGRIVADPVLRYTQSNTAVASFRIAVDRDFVKADSAQKTDFINCVAWRQTGEFISKYFHKGEMIALNGKLQMRNWKDDSGNNRTSAEVIVDTAYFCGSKKEKESASSDNQKQTFTELGDDDGELPFSLNEDDELPL